VPDTEAGCCLGPEENGVSPEEGGKGGPGPQEAGKISSQCSARAGTTWARTRTTDSSDVMKEDLREQSERYFEQDRTDQGCGSGSGRIRNYLHVRIRIRNLILDPDPSAVVFQHTVR
jgi:hypothetical protein